MPSHFFYFMGDLFNFKPQDVDISNLNLKPRKNRSRSSTYKIQRNCMERQERINRRNKALVARWYYWTELVRLRADDALNKLSEEFYIEEQTITRALLDNDGYLRELIANQTTRKQLRKTYNYFNWM